jgi:hypothetical protein
MTLQPLSVGDLFPDQLLQALRTEAGLTDIEVAALLPYAGAFSDLAALHKASVIVLLEIARPNPFWPEMHITGPYPEHHLKTYFEQVRAPAAGQATAGISPLHLLPGVVMPVDAGLFINSSGKLHRTTVLLQ